MPKEEQLIPHKHCAICGKAISENRVFCSTKCEGLSTKRDKRYRTMSRLYYLFFAATILILAIIFLTGLR